MEQGKVISEIALEAAGEKKARDPVLMDLRNLTLVTDYFLIMHGSSQNQIRSIVKEIRDRLEASGFEPLRREGSDASGWVLLDYGDAIIHIFSREKRDYYDLERLWGDARVVVG